ncbi:MAG: hypothetical protein MK168_02545 [Candidatus Thalassarchaeum sp.]|nr:hypothetical protein [Candidatus Thalassarchaeum sp.]
MSNSSLPTDLSPTVAASIEMQSEVRDFFGWRESEDHDSAMALLSSVEDSGVPSWEGHNRLAALSKLYRRMVIRKVEIAVLGAAVEPEELTQVLENPVLLVPADGATGVLSELPSSISEKAWSRLACVVSDADGGSGTIEAVKRAIPIVLHAHGDNREDWKGLLEQAKSQVEPSDLILTHQTSGDIPGMHNPGGFTDGDRAVCFLLALGVERQRISLLGTRTDIVGRWSGKTDEDRKMEKLAWMSRVLHMHGF